MNEGLDTDYFSREIELIGEEKLKALSNKKVAILGCGGLGCSISIALAGCGVGNLDLVDFDKVSLSNIHRQIAFRFDDIHKYKCEVLKKHLDSRTKGLNISTYTSRLQDYLKSNTKIDLIIDATDNLPSRADISEFARNNKIPWIYASVEEWHGQVCFFEKSDFSFFKINDKKPGGVATPIVMNIASISANLAFMFLIGNEVIKDTLYYINFNGGILDIKRLKMAPFQEQSV